MKIPSTLEAHEMLRNALRAAAIGEPSELRYAIATMTAIEACAMASWVSQAWNNGYARGSDDATIKAVYSPVTPPVQPDNPFAEILPPNPECSECGECSKGFVKTESGRILCYSCNLAEAEASPTGFAR